MDSLNVFEKPLREYPRSDSPLQWAWTFDTQCSFRVLQKLQQIADKRQQRSAFNPPFSVIFCLRCPPSQCTQKFIYSVTTFLRINPRPLVGKRRKWKKENINRRSKATWSSYQKINTLAWIQYLYSHLKNNWEIINKKEVDV